ncbi:DUF3662 and FHA domain-containing protein [Dendrosporobacter sp. 1207_IL3150]|uniref:DUF3662 and FHA domain-containing protein n=1 Tax=Dendrosporobacter sp. 1207_IL3150 TaxID=3084054 RepID=UPI002FDAAB31
MTFVRNLENIFEKYIEGFFNKKFSSGLQPVELAKQLVKEMNNQRSVGISQIYVPNSYMLYLNKDDFERIAPYGAVIRDELSKYLVDEAARKKYIIVGPPIVDIFRDEDLGRGRFRIASHFTEPLPNENHTAENDLVEYKESDTRVFEKCDFEVLKNYPENRISAKLTVAEGLDEGMTVKVGLKRINIGRRESNEMPLTDMNTSRLHAYIIYDDKSHILYDAKSLNGTYINGHRITRKTLHHDDQIKVGNTIIRYEVS